MNNPLISIIIPIYNVEKFLPECLDSVVNQTYTNLEIILVNDGSPDGSDRICKTYALKDTRIKYIVQKNGGLSNARNNGLKAAHGRYYFFLDSDDYLSNTCIEKLVKASTSYNLPVTGYILNLSDECKQITPKQNYGIYNNIHEFLLDFHKYFATKSNFVWGKLYDASIIKRNGLEFEEGISLVEDILFNIQYYSFLNGSIAMLTDNGYYYRQHGNATLSKRFNPKMFEWNELGYSSVRNFLVKYDTMTNQNRICFYTNVFGNLIYSLKLLNESKDYTVAHKIELIKKLTSTPLAIETFNNADITSFETKLYACNLSHGNIYSFMFINKLFNLLRKVKHAFN